VSWLPGFSKVYRNPAGSSEQLETGGMEGGYTRALEPRTDRISHLLPVILAGLLVQHDRQYFER
jgi:hypothetical protein